MRTREEQIAALFPGYYAEDAEATITKGDLRLMLDQVERRAEQRVRAEIARDSERLDWLAEQILRVQKRTPYQPIIIDGKYDPSELRNAIDAARENAND